MQIIKNIRVIVIFLLLLVSSYFLASPFVFKKSGVIVTSFSKDSKCSQLKEGDIITQISGSFIRTLEDFERAAAAVKSGEYVAMVVNNGPGDCVAIHDGDIGLNVAGTPSGQLNFGIDIQGGTIATISLDGTTTPADLNKLAQTIEKRVKFFGLPQTYVYTSNNTIKIASLTTERISALIVPGEFKAKITQEVGLENSTGVIKIGNRLYDVKQYNTKISVNGTAYSPGQSFILEDIKFDLINATNNSFTAEANIFTNDDISKIFTGYERYNPDLRSYEFYIPLEISRSASDRFIKIAKGLKSSLTGSQIILQGQVVYYLDGETISKLNIPYDMTIKEINSISVVGFGSTRTQVANQKTKILAMLQSDVLPVNLKITGIEPLEPKSKLTVIYASVSFALFLLLAVVSTFYFRYKSVKLGSYALLMGSIEIVLIIGIAALTQGIYSPSWIIDWQTIIGIIAVASLSSIQLLLITEKMLKNKIMNLNYKYKKMISLPMLLNILVLIVSFLMLFTTWKGFGLSLLAGLVIEVALTRSIYKDIVTSSHS